eukprot:4753846-Karenia_brevis.AAC.1
MSCVYRVWAARRLQDLQHWQEAWATSGQHAYRQKHSVHDVFWSIALKVEASLLSDEDLFGINFDYVKCFDLVPHGLIMELAASMGMSPRILAPMKAMYTNLKRHFRIAGHVGSEFKSTNGILQGCQMSVILLNALVM